MGLSFTVFLQEVPDCFFQKVIQWLFKVNGEFFNLFLKVAFKSSG